jgi:ferrochelatase
MSERGVLLVNLGTPDAPTPAALRRYLREFLSDPDVIDLPAPLRLALVHAIIVPFRAPKSAHAYASIWTAGESPLRLHTRALAEAVAQALAERRVAVEWGMRYGHPGIGPALDRLRERGVRRLTVVPLYPQYAQSTVASSLRHLHRLLGDMRWSPELDVVAPFHRDEGYIESQAATIRPLLTHDSHLLLSFHGLPERHIRRSSPECERCLPQPGCPRLEHALCYRGQCFETARDLVARLGLAAGSWSVAFQSRLGRARWIQPSTEDTLVELARKGVRRLVVACPSFVADGLESLEEIGQRGREAFISAGGAELVLAPCPNASPLFVEAVTRLADTGAAPHAVHVA